MEQIPKAELLWVETMVIKLNGNWEKGIAIDLHTKYSEYLGVDEFGHDRFDTVRTELGENVYKLKYQQDKSALPLIIKEIQGIKWIGEMDIVIPVPPSKIGRRFQPVYEIAKAIGRTFNVKVLLDAIVKTDTNLELKDIVDIEERKKILSDAFTINSQYKLESMKVLIVDDLYRSGSTLNAVTNLLYDEGDVLDVYVLTVTKTRSNR